MPTNSRARRSPCPIAYALDLLGDRWTLLVLRDMALDGRRYFQEFVDSSEGIATNVLSDRLDRLESAGLVAKERDQNDRRRWLYRLTPRGVDTLPILLELVAWGGKHDPDTPVTKGFLEDIETRRDELLGKIRRTLDVVVAAS